MSIETLLHDEIAPLCERVFPDVAPWMTQRPYVTWKQIGGDAPGYVEGAVMGLRNALVQVDVHADTRIEASQLMLAIEAVLVSSTAMQAEAQGAMRADGDGEGLERIYAASQDFSIWAAR